MTYLLIIFDILLVIKVEYALDPMSMIKVFFLFIINNLKIWDNLAEPCECANLLAGKLILSACQSTEMREYKLKSRIRTRLLLHSHRSRLEPLDDDLSQETEGSQEQSHRQ